jgi:hypothetical protein
MVLRSKYYHLVLGQWGKKRRYKVMTELSAARVSSAEAEEEKIFEPEPNKSWGNPEPYGCLFRGLH